MRRIANFPRPSRSHSFMARRTKFRGRFQIQDGDRRTLRRAKTRCRLTPSMTAKTPYNHALTGVWNHRGLLSISIMTWPVDPGRVTPTK